MSVFLDIAVIGDPPLGILIIYWLVVPILAMAFTGASKRRTIGMAYDHLLFARSDGGKISFLRCCCRIICGFAMLPLASISLIIAWNDPLRRSLADLMMGTIVIQSPGDRRFRNGEGIGDTIIF
jgi:uncharacterized RDD family membrane protein YckC